MSRRKRKADPDPAFEHWWKKMSPLVVHPYEGDDHETFVKVLCALAWGNGEQDGFARGCFHQAMLRNHHRLQNKP